MSYGYKKKIELPFDQALASLKAELRKEKLETVTEINLKATLKDSLNLEIGSYVILGVCSAMVARDMLMAEKETGIFLPFNVVIYEELKDVWISAVKPTIQVGKGINPYLENIVGEVEIAIEKAIEKISSNDKENKGNPISTTS